MVGNEENSSIKAIDWYISILDRWPDSKDELYDLSGEYANNAFVSFLAYMAPESTAKSSELRLVVANYRQKLLESAALQEEIWSTLESSFDTRICDILCRYSWRLTCNPKQDVISLQIENGPNVALESTLGEHGYQLTKLWSHSDVLDLSLKSTSETIAALEKELGK